MYDIIGDIHGEAATLEALLHEMGYTESGGAYRHPSRKVIFVGDYIDRGPENLRVVAIVRAMVEKGSALAIMGNHEINAVHYHMPDPNNPGSYLRKHTEKNQHQHETFLKEAATYPDQAQAAIEWFKTLPLWIETEAFRVVHACWSPAHIACLKADALNSDNVIKDDTIWHRSADKQDEIYHAVEAVLKGIECELPSGLFFHDKDGNKRTQARVNWWCQNPTSVDDTISLPSTHNVTFDLLEPYLPLHTIEMDRPVFFGHYWRHGEPELLSTQHVCTDWSVAKGGYLAAYRFSGEPSPTNDNWVYVKRLTR